VGDMRCAPVQVFLMHASTSFSNACWSKFCDAPEIKKTLHAHGIKKIIFEEIFSNDYFRKHERSWSSKEMRWKGS
jgi:hypothetical protein